MVPPEVVRSVVREPSLLTAGAAIPTVVSDAVAFLAPFRGSMTDHQFCSLHRIAYDSRLDPVCPQCTLARVQPQAQHDYDIVSQAPIDSASGKLLDRKTLQPVA